MLARNRQRTNLASCCQCNDMITVMRCIAEMRVSRIYQIVRSRPEFWKSYKERQTQVSYSWIGGRWSTSFWRLSCQKFYVVSDKYLEIYNRDHFLLIEADLPTTVEMCVSRWMVRKMCVQAIEPVIFPANSNSEFHSKKRECRRIKVSRWFRRSDMMGWLLLDWKFMLFFDHLVDVTDLIW